MDNQKEETKNKIMEQLKDLGPNQRLNMYLKICKDYHIKYEPNIEQELVRHAIIFLNNKYNND